MAALVMNMVQRLNEVLALTDSLLTAEKAKIVAIKQEANNDFMACYKDFTDVQTKTVAYNPLGSLPFASRHPQLHVMTAQAAFYTENYAIAKTVLNLYFQREPQKDQFYCSGKVLKALLINHDSCSMNGVESIHFHNLAVEAILEALAIALSPKHNLGRYKFLVFNISTALFKIVQPFLRPSRAKFFAAPMTKMVEALEAQDDPDKDWRVLMLSAAAVCLEDDKQAKPAEALIEKAIAHIEGKLAITTTQYNALMAELTEVSAEAARVMSAFRAIEERAIQLKKPRKIDPDEAPEVALQPYDPTEFLAPLEGLAAEGAEKVKEMLDDSQKKKAVVDKRVKEVTDLKLQQQETVNRLYMQRISISPGESKKILALPSVMSNIRASTLTTLQCLLSNAITDKEWDVTFKSMLAKLKASVGGGQEAGGAARTRVETLLDVCRVAWKLKQRSVAIQCYDMAQEAGASIVSPLIRVKLDICEGIRALEDVQVLSINKTTKQRLTAKQMDGFVSSKRIEVIKALERSLSVVMGRLGDEQLAQEICLIIWNASITLLQPHLRLKVYTAIKAVSTTLEAIASPLTFLRSQAHFEVAKCEDQTDFLSIAQDEAHKALACDFGTVDPTPYKKQPPIWSECARIPDPEMDRNRPQDLGLKPFSELLEIRGGIYDAPSDTEGKVFMLLQQTKETKSKDVFRSLLVKSMLLLLPEVDPTFVPPSSSAGASSSSSSSSSAKGKAAPSPIPPVSLDRLEAAINTPRVATADAQYKEFTKLLQKRMLIMATIASTGQALQCTEIVQHCACYMLSHTINAEDKLLHSLVNQQIQAYYVLSESLISRITLLPINVPETASDKSDPRRMGVDNPYATAEMASIKKLVLTCLNGGIQLSLKIRNSYTCQNGIVYFWNMHMHVFRGGLYTSAIEEVYQFLGTALAALDALQPPKATMPGQTNIAGALDVDGRLRLAILESQAGFLEARQQMPAAIEVASKGCQLTSASEYSRRKLCELVGRLSVLAASDGGGGKGGKAKGGSGPTELPTYDNVFLSVFGGLAQAEQPEPGMPTETTKALTDKMVDLMKTKVVEFLATIDMEDQSQERFCQLIEMQTEAWARLMRLRLKLGDTIGAQECADACMALLAKENMSKNDLENVITPRVWRWVSVCKKLLGVAVASIIQPEGQDESLQNELRLAALVHFTLATDYAIKAGNEPLVLEAASSAWNVSMNMIELTAMRARLYDFQRRIVNNLLKCVGEPCRDAVALLRQQFYLAIIEGFANVYDWAACLKMVMEAFQHVPQSLQKPLWKWRVVAMSKRGKSVLDGLQKLKENNPRLQANVMGILARASADMKLQLESYMKAIDILDGDLERVDYILECAQFMATAGLPKADIQQLLMTGTDALYEVEELSLPEDQFEADAPDDLTEYGDPEVRSAAGGDLASFRQGGGGTKSSAAGTNRGEGTRGSVSSSVGRGSVAGSRASGSRAMTTSSAPPPEVPPLTLKQLEQAYRSLAMTAMLESKADARVEKCVELVYFVEKSLALWFSAILAIHRRSVYDALPDETKEATPFDEAYIETVPVPQSMVVPADVMALLTWQSCRDFEKATQAAVESKPLGLDSKPPAANELRDAWTKIPSKETYPLLQLSLYYLDKTVDTLHNAGFSKHALGCLGWTRLLLLTIAQVPGLEGINAALAKVQLKTIGLLRDVQLFDEAKRVPTLLRQPTETLKDGQEPTTPITIASYITDFVRSKTQKDAGAEVKLRESFNQEGVAGPYGLFTYTATIDGIAIDRNLFLLAVCPLLISNGQTALAQCLILLLRKEFAKTGDTRSEVECGTMLNQINISNGRFDDAVTSLLSLQGGLALTGDVAQLAGQTTLLLQALVRLGKTDDGKVLAASALQTIEQASFFTIDKNALAKKNEETKALQTQTLLTAKMTGATKTVGTVSRTSGMGNSSSSSSTANATRSRSVVDEASFDGVTAFGDILSCYMDVIVEDAVKMAAEKGADPQGSYVDLCDNLSRSHDLAIDVAGPVSDLSARILTKRASAACEFLMRINSYSNACATVPEGEYVRWFRDNVLMCLEYTDKVVLIRKEIDALVPREERAYSNPAIRERSAKVGAGESVAPYVEFSLPTTRALGRAMLQAATLQIVLGTLDGTHESATVDSLIKKQLSVAEQFLEDSKLPTDVDLDFFKLSGFHKAESSLLEAGRLLKGTDFAVEASFLRAIARVMRFCGDGTLDPAWNRDVEGANALTFSENAEQSRSALVERTREMLIAELPGPYAHVPYACVALLFSFGHNSPAAAAGWVMQLQSHYARKWLSEIWESSLNPSSPVYAAWMRLQSLQAQRQPSQEEAKQVAAETAFLRSVSVPFGRLSVAQDPLQIFNTLPAGTMLLCVQLCPLQQTLFVAAGYVATGAKSVTDGAIDAQWFVRKAKLLEADRRALQRLLVVHKQWTQEMTKFTAAYGELTTPNFDVSNDPSSSKNSKNLLNAEKRLSVRLQDTIAEMEKAFAPLLGAEAPLAAFVQSAMSAMSSTARGGIAGPSVVLLLDVGLQALPWEGLSCVAPFGGRVGRDFSLHMLSHRIQTLASSAKPSDLSAPQDLQLPPPSAPTVPADKMSFVVDPFSEDNGCRQQFMERESMRSLVAQQIDTGSIKGGKRWANIRKGDGFIALQDWLGAMDRSSMPKLIGDGAAPTGLFLYSLGRLGSLLPTSEIVVMNLEKVALLVCIDQGHNDASYRRQVSGDTLKRPKDVDAEAPLQLAAALSLAGTGSMVTHLWATPFAAQNRLLGLFWERFSDKKGSVLQCLGASRTFEQDVAAAAEGDVSGVDNRVKSVKLWAQCSRTVFGLPTIEYAA